MQIVAVQFDMVWQNKPANHDKVRALLAEQTIQENALIILPEMFDTGFICYDLRFPEIFRPTALDGAELLVVIASWPETRSEHWVRLLPARGIENQAFTVGVNRCGTDPSQNCDGRSTAFDPLGVVLFKADAREQVIAVNIDTDAARRWRAQFPALADVRQDYRC